MYKIEMTYGELFEYMGWDESAYGESQYPDADKILYVKTPNNEYTPIRGGVVKENLDMMKIKFSGGSECEVADKHLFSYKGKYITASDAERVDTINGEESIISKTSIGKHDGYDINIDSPHWYTNPNGIIYHNTLFLHNMAADYLLKGYDVMYFTLEMAEEKISERIDAKLMDIDLDAMKILPKKSFENKIDTIKNTTKGKLIVKEFPPGTINCNHIRSILEDAKIKINFRPTVIMVDYLNLMTSVRMKSGGENSYSYIKSIAEELRGIFVEYEVCGWTATQTNRSGQNASDFDLNEVSESHGLSMTADFMVGMISTTDMEEMNQIRFKLLKNRYGPMSEPSSWVCGINRSKMSLYDLDKPTTAINKSDKDILQKMPDNSRVSERKSKFKFE